MTLCWSLPQTDCHITRLITGQNWPLCQEACLHPGPRHGSPPRVSGPFRAISASSSGEQLSTTLQRWSRITEKSTCFDNSSGHIFFALGGVTMVMRSDEKVFLSAGDTQMHMAVWGGGDGV